MSLCSYRKLSLDDNAVTNSLVNTASTAPLCLAYRIDMILAFGIRMRATHNCHLVCLCSFLTTRISDSHEAIGIAMAAMIGESGNTRVRPFAALPSPAGIFVG